MGLKKYDVTTESGFTTTLLLSDRDAAKQGLKPNKEPGAKAAAQPANKGRGAANKGRTAAAKDPAAPTGEETPPKGQEMPGGDQAPSGDQTPPEGDDKK